MRTFNLETRHPDPDRHAAGCLRICHLRFVHERIVESLDSAPDFPSLPITDAPSRRRAFAGKLLVLNFWATWCPPCVEELLRERVCESLHQSRLWCWHQPWTATKKSIAISSPGPCLIPHRARSGQEDQRRLRYLQISGELHHRWQRQSPAQDHQQSGLDELQSDQKTWNPCLMLPPQATRRSWRRCSALVATSTAEDLLLYEYDGSVDKARPELVGVRARRRGVGGRQDYGQAQSSHRGRGAGTGLSGGAIPRARRVTIGFARMNRILEIDLENERPSCSPAWSNLDITWPCRRRATSNAPDPSSHAPAPSAAMFPRTRAGRIPWPYGVTNQSCAGTRDGVARRLGLLHRRQGA